MAQLSDDTGGLTVLTPEGDGVALRELWRERPAMLFLVRHFGCQWCREQMRDLGSVMPELRAAGVQPVVIGNGTPLMAQAFVEETSIDVPLYTDPDRAVYRALGTKRPGPRALLNPRLWWNTIRAAAKGLFPHAVQGDAAQLGGVFLVKPGGELTYAHRSEVGGDHPRKRDLVEAARSA